MRKPLGRIDRSTGSLAAGVAGTALLLGVLSGCSSGAGNDTSVVRAEPVAEALGQAQAALTLNTAPESVAFELDLDGQHVELSLERSKPPTASDYKAFRRTASGELVVMPPVDLGCSYRGVAALAGSAEQPGFAAMSVCASDTGHAAGDAASGVLRAAGRFWRLWPDPADTDASDGIDHFAQPLHRNDSPPSAFEPPRRVTLARLPETPAPRLEFREGTDAETKYVDLIAVNDAARVDELGNATEQTTVRFVDTMNALLEGSGIEPRLRVTLRAQVLFDEDPYTSNIVGGEVDNDELLNNFLNFGLDADLPVHDEHMLLSGLDFVGGVVGYAGLNVACTNNANGFIVQAGDSSGGFAVLSAVHEMGHTLGMNHDDGSREACPTGGYIMAAVGCGNCTGAEEAQFSVCSIEQFQTYLAGPSYTGCADDVPLGAAPSCGDAVVEEGETCDCGSDDCSDIDPCCNGATCQLDADAECSDFNDGCCLNCAVVAADADFVCRSARSECDIPEVCTGSSKECPADTFEAAGSDCSDARDNDGACYFGDCRSRDTQCEQIAESQNSAQFENVSGPPAGCNAGCNAVVCGNGTNSCITIGGPSVVDGVSCNGGNGQCVNEQCVTTIDQCPNDPGKQEPGDCGCGSPDTDTDGDGTANCIDGCPQDGAKVAPGDCGCGTPDTDTDGDGAANCIDECPADATKSDPGDCGCGSPDIDTDRDGSADCVDECPSNPAISVAGSCGCEPSTLDTDLDGTPDCDDECPNEAGRTEAPCLPPANAGSSKKDDGGCSLAIAPAPSQGTGSVGQLAALLALAALPLWRRRKH